MPALLLRDLEGGIAWGDSCSTLPSERGAPVQGLRFAVESCEGGQYSYPRTCTPCLKMLAAERERHETANTACSRCGTPGTLCTRVPGTVRTLCTLCRRAYARGPTFCLAIRVLYDSGILVVYCSLALCAQCPVPKQSRAERGGERRLRVRLCTQSTFVYRHHVLRVVYTLPGLPGRPRRSGIRCCG